MTRIAYEIRGFGAIQCCAEGFRNGRISGIAKGQVALTNLTLLATVSIRPKGA